MALTGHDFTMLEVSEMNLPGKVWIQECMTTGKIRVTKGLPYKDKESPNTRMIDTLTKDAPAIDAELIESADSKSDEQNNADRFEKAKRTRDADYPSTIEECKELFDGIIQKNEMLRREGSDDVKAIRNWRDNDYYSSARPTLKQGKWDKFARRLVELTSVPAIDTEQRVAPAIEAGQVIESADSKSDAEPKRGLAVFDLALQIEKDKDAAASWTRRFSSDATITPLGKCPIDGRKQLYDLAEMLAEVKRIHGITSNHSARIFKALKPLERLAVVTDSPKN